MPHRISQAARTKTVSAGLSQPTIRRETDDTVSLFRHLLVPIGPRFDCHPPCRPILDLVEKWQSEVVLLTARDPGPSETTLSTDLSALTRQLKQVGSPRVHVTSSADRPCVAIEQTARRFHSSLIIMSPGLQESPELPWFGTVLQRLIRRPPVPLLVLNSHQPVSFDAILCVVEESEPALEAVRQSTSMARSFHCHLTLLNAIAPTSSLPVDETTIWDFHSRHRRGRPFAPSTLDTSTWPDEGMNSPLTDNECEFMGRVQRECGLDGVEYEARIAVGSPAVQAALLSRKRKRGLIVAGAAPRAGFTFGLPRTTAEAVAEASDLPVLVMP